MTSRTRRFVAMAAGLALLGVAGAPAPAHANWQGGGMILVGGLTSVWTSPATAPNTAAWWNGQQCSTAGYDTALHRDHTVGVSVANVSNIRNQTKRLRVSAALANGEGIVRFFNGQCAEVGSLTEGLVGFNRNVTIPANATWMSVGAGCRTIGGMFGGCVAVLAEWQLT